MRLQPGINPTQGSVSEQRLPSPSYPALQTQLPKRGVHRSAPEIPAPAAGRRPASRGFRAPPVRQGGPGHFWGLQSDRPRWKSRPHLSAVVGPWASPFISRRLFPHLEDGCNHGAPSGAAVKSTGADARGALPGSSHLTRLNIWQPRRSYWAGTCLCNSRHCLWFSREQLCSLHWGSS